MARLDRKNRPNLTLIQGGKKDKNWQKIYNVGLLVLVLGLYVLFLIGH